MKDGSTRCATSEARPTASPRSRSSRTVRSAGKSSSRRAERRNVSQRPAGNVPASRAHACRLHQQDENREVEVARGDSRAGRDRRSARGSSTRPQRASEAVESRRGGGPNLPLEPWRRGRRKSATRRFSRTCSRSARCSASIHHRSLDQVVDPSWLTAAVGASAAVSEGSERENLLAEIKTLSPPALDRRAVDAWNELVSSDRARLLPRASLVREAKRLFETGTIEKGRCPLCGQKVDAKLLARTIERALVEVMEASRELERLRDPIVQQADDFEVAHDKRLSILSRARAIELELPPVPDVPHAAVRESVEALAPVDVAGITSAMADLRKWDRAAGALARRRAGGTQHSRHATRHAGRFMPAGERLAARGEESDARSPGAGARRAGLRRVSEQAEGGSGRAA